MRRDGAWDDPTEEEIEESEDYELVTIGPFFIEVFDAAQASGTVLDLGAGQEYKTWLLAGTTIRPERCGF